MSQPKKPPALAVGSIVTARSLLLATTMLVAPVIAHAACIRVGPGESIQAAIDAARPGDVILLTPGDYRTGELRLKSGVTLRGDGGRAVINCAGSGACLRLNDVEGVRLENLGVTGATQGADGARWAPGISVVDSDNNEVRNVESYGNGGAGIHFYGNSGDNLVVDSSFHDNYDPDTGGTDADGIQFNALTSGATGNRVDNTRVYGNSDDGLDLWESEVPVTITNSEAYNNGRDRGDGNGFKLGQNSTGPNHTLIGSIAYGNRANGFDDNNGVGTMTLRDNASYDNGGQDYRFDTARMSGSGNVTSPMRRPSQRGGRCIVATVPEMTAFCANPAATTSPSCVAFRRHGTLPEGCDEAPSDGCGGTVVADLGDVLPASVEQAETAAPRRNPQQNSTAAGDDSHVKNSDHTRWSKKLTHEDPTDVATSVPATTVQPHTERRRGRGESVESPTSSGDTKPTHRSRQRPAERQSIAPVAPLPSGNPSAEGVLFSDEFDGPAGARPGTPWRFFDAWGSGQWRDAVYDENHATLDGNGNLVITGEPDGDRLRTSYLQTFDWLNPDAPGEGKFGPGKYVEVRADLSGCKASSSWCAIWSFDPTHTYDGNPANGTEIDIAEATQANDWAAQRYTVNNHWAKGQGSGDGRWVEGADPRTGFHTYGIDWQADKLSYYFDDRKVWETTKGVSTSNNQALVLSIENANGTNNPWAPGTSIDGPSRMVVDYVKVYDGGKP